MNYAFDRERVRPWQSRARPGGYPDETSEFVYTTYIKTTPERLWQALTDPAFTRRYWCGFTFESDWTVGSPLAVERGAVRLGEPPQVVLESETVSSTLLHLARQEASGGRSKVTFVIEPHGQMVKLTVVHGDFEPGSRVLEPISGGWPRRPFQPQDAARDR